MTISEFRVPAFCPQCELVMKGGPGTNSIYYDWGVCLACFIEFIEGREERWKEGWRPTSDQVATMISKLYPDPE